jgi:sodium pump decarboxylase gamma subunit
MDDALAVGLRLTVTGMVVVFSGLVLLFLLMQGFQHFDQWLEKQKTRKQKRRQRKRGAAPSPSPATESPEGAVPPEVLAAISAAVALATDRKVRIKRIRYRAPSEAAWSRQGRVTIMASHVTRR